MIRRRVVVVWAFIGLAACSHHGAVRVQCEGPLRPINRPDANPPVSVAPGAPLMRDGDSQP